MRCEEPLAAAAAAVVAAPVVRDEFLLSFDVFRIGSLQQVRKEGGWGKGG